MMSNGWIHSVAAKTSNNLVTNALTIWKCQIVSPVYTFTSVGLDFCIWVWVEQCDNSENRFIFTSCAKIRTRVWFERLIWYYWGYIVSNHLLLKHQETHWSKNRNFILENISRARDINIPSTFKNNLSAPWARLVIGSKSISLITLYRSKEPTLSQNADSDH
jgi:hypothetical protein